ncbi:hypothetical protein CA13_32710 [Planctomycetes bacterium CA13]|uniref:Uncharacterized protein n=1 Tax=Novipirellula herctigrandis TaxID=2527986 RepID=A0A5C5Z3A9_9BACT|nr:hypothetical protein CA13_32710 [Planctomycetes bacterium CA13]
MTPDDSHETPFQIDDADSDENAVEVSTEQTENPPSHHELTEVEATTDPYESGEEVVEPDVVEANQAWDEDDPKLAELAEPFVGQWNTLISTTNWEKGEIIHNWRHALIDSGAPSTEYSDDAWARRVGGVTAPHVGRLRRVFERFGSTYATYKSLYWSHFLAALDWDDAAMWLEGAVQESWSVSGMREKRWEATGAVESQRPTSSQIVEVDTDEDVVLPAQGGGRTKEYGDDPDGVAAGPRHEDPDFGDTEEFQSLEANRPQGDASGLEVEDPDQPAVSQPFAGLPELPDDLADAIESLKLAVLRHKTAKWERIDAESVQRYLDAIGTLIQS